MLQQLIDTLHQGLETKSSRPGLPRARPRPLIRCTGGGSKRTIRSLGMPITTCRRVPGETSGSSTVMKVTVPSWFGNQGTSQYAGRAPRLCLASLEHFDLAGTPQPGRLFHLVQHNVLRGLVANEELLATFATLLIPHGADRSPCQLVEKVYPGRAALVTASIAFHETCTLRCCRATVSIPLG